MCFMMGPVVTTALVLISLAIYGGQAYNWSSRFQGGQIVYSCVGKRVDFAWELTLEKGETIVVITWTFYGYFTSHQIATDTGDYFNPTPEYTNRVTQMGNAGISLHNVTESDNGNYSVTVSGTDGSGNSFTFEGMAALQIADSLLVEEQELKVTQLPEAIKIKDTGKWSVALACGKFIHLGVPPFPVHWTTPSGEIITESSDYQDGHYILLLPNPVKGGNYTCEVPQLYAEDACLGADSHHKAKASVVVDGTQARLSLLEAHQAELLQENEMLKLKSESQLAAVGELNSTMNQKAEDLSSRLEGVENTASQSSVKIQSQEDRLTELDRKVKARVSFHARLTSTLNSFQGRLQPFAIVTNNEGDAFNITTGIFTAPVSGTYFLAGTSTSVDNGRYVHMALQRDGTSVSFAYARSGSGSQSTGACHAVVHLSVGERVWLQSTYPTTQYYMYSTYFTGFLISIED